MVFAAPAQADPDTDFAKELHSYGIYGQKDYNAWIGKIACKRLDRGVDLNARDSAKFVSDQLLARQQHRTGLAVPGRGNELLLPRQARSAHRTQDEGKR